MDEVIVENEKFYYNKVKYTLEDMMDEEFYIYSDEVVDKYNIDGIILDDYFYPYPVEGVEFSDKSTYEKYGQEFNSKEDWRRNNVDN